MNVTTEYLIQLIGKQTVMIDCLETQLKEAHAQLNAASAQNKATAQTQAAS